MWTPSQKLLLEPFRVPVPIGTHVESEARQDRGSNRSNPNSNIQVQEFHQMRTQSWNPSVIKRGLAEGQTEKRYKTDIQLQEFLSYYRSSFPTTGVPFQLQEFLSNYRSSFPTTGAPFQLREFLSNYRSSFPTAGVPFQLQEFPSYYRSSNPFTVVPSKL